MQNIAFYHFEDPYLVSAVCEKFNVSIVPPKLSATSVSRNIKLIVFHPHDVPMGTSIPTVSVDDFIQEHLSETMGEIYYFTRFCIEQGIDDDTVEPSELIAQVGAQTAKELYEGFVCVKTAQVHVLDITPTEHPLKAKKESEVETAYTRALHKVFCCKEWQAGDMVVVKSLLKPGCNCGKFMYNGHKLLTLDHRVDRKNGSLGPAFPVISQYPIGYWAGKIECPEGDVQMIEHNSLVYCKVSKNVCTRFMRQRAALHQRIKEDKASVTPEDRVIIIHVEGVAFAAICEFHIEEESDCSVESCNAVMRPHSTGFYAQFARINCDHNSHGPCCLVSNEQYMGMMECCKDEMYVRMIHHAVTLGVAPNNIVFIDIGGL